MQNTAERERACVQCIEEPMSRRVWEPKGKRRTTLQLCALDRCSTHVGIADTDKHIKRAPFKKRMNYMRPRLHLLAIHSLATSTPTGQNTAITLPVSMTMADALFSNEPSTHLFIGKANPTDSLFGRLRHDMRSACPLFCVCKNALDGSRLVSTEKEDQFM